MEEPTLDINNLTSLTGPLLMTEDLVTPAQAKVAAVLGEPDLALCLGHIHKVSAPATLIYDLAPTYLKLGRWDYAWSVTTQALNSPVLSLSDQVVALRRRGIANYHMQQYDSALADFTYTLTLDPQDFVALKTRGCVYNQLERYEEALIDLTDALEVGYNADVFKKRGIIYYNLKRYEEAVADFSKALELIPADYHTLVNRGLTYRHLKARRRAISDFTEALRLRPNDLASLFSRGLVYAENEMYDAALMDLVRVHELHPISEFVANLIEKLRTYKNISETPPPELSYKLARFNAKQGNTELALTRLLTAVRADPVYRQRAKQDREFEGLRSHPFFRALTGLPTVPIGAG